MCVGVGAGGERLCENIHLCASVTQHQVAIIFSQHMASVFSYLWLSVAHMRACHSQLLCRWCLWCVSAAFQIFPWSSSLCWTWTRACSHSASLEAGQALCKPLTFINSAKFLLILWVQSLLFLSPWILKLTEPHSTTQISKSSFHTLLCWCLLTSLGFIFYFVDVLHEQLLNQNVRVWIWTSFYFHILCNLFCWNS